jgi:hypothetical protein
MLGEPWIAEDGADGGLRALAAGGNAAAICGREGEHSRDLLDVSTVQEPTLRTLWLQYRSKSGHGNGTLPDGQAEVVSYFG